MQNLPLWSPSLGDVTLNADLLQELLTAAAVQAVLGMSSGTFTLNGATPVSVGATQITANSAIIITLKTVGGTVGAQPHVETITAGTGFSVVGTASDTSVYNYTIIG